MYLYLYSLAEVDSGLTIRTCPGHHPTKENLAISTPKRTVDFIRV